MEKITNFEKIKEMNVQELAEFLGLISYCANCKVGKICNASKNKDCKDNFIKWLEQEVEE